MSFSEVDPSVCPLCGSPNECGSIAGKEAGTCWCYAETFSPALLEKVPPESRRKACVCRDCARKNG
ncbi:cysteine-rich CWC family protein [Cohnella suwonensis]|uniref:Cysteine-rich CWC family protein n=1 Tax=Cohnella suwonensis TaxID=696072 RepID=A0ABW0M0M9_9BACL